jgi:hypothetical protein
MSAPSATTHENGHDEPVLTGAEDVVVSPCDVGAGAVVVVGVSAGVLDSFMSPDASAEAPPLVLPLADALTLAWQAVARATGAIRATSCENRMMNA